MPKFVAIHTLPPGGMTPAQVAEVGRASQQDPEVKGDRSFINLTEGKAVCVFEAPSKETLSAWFQKMGLPCDSITQLELEGERGEVRKV